MGHRESDWESWDDEGRSKETTAARLFSSGTTGLPKAVEMTHHNFIAQHTMVVEWKPRDYEVWKTSDSQHKGRCLHFSGNSSALHSNVPCIQRPPSTHFACSLRHIDLHSPAFPPRNLAFMHSTLLHHRSKPCATNGHPDTQLSAYTKVLPPFHSQRMGWCSATGCRNTTTLQEVTQGRRAIQSSLGHVRDELYCYNGALP